MEQTKSEWMDKICPQGKEHKIVLNNHGIKVGIERQRYNQTWVGPNSSILTPSFNIEHCSH